VVGTLFNIAGAASLVLTLPALASLPPGVVPACLVLAGTVTLLRVVYVERRDSSHLRESLDSRRDTDERRHAFGAVIQMATTIDREICGLSGEAKRTTEPHYRALHSDWRQRADSVVLRYAEHRFGYYASDAGLGVSSGLPGWRDELVSDMRRRVIRLNEIQAASV
jgi:hypothetical protein